MMNIVLVNPRKPAGAGRRGCKQRNRVCGKPHGHENSTPEHQYNPCVKPSDIQKQQTHIM